LTSRLVDGTRSAGFGHQGNATRQLHVKIGKLGVFATCGKSTQLTQLNRRAKNLAESGRFQPLCSTCTLVFWGVDEYGLPTLMAGRGPEGEGATTRTQPPPGPGLGPEPAAGVRGAAGAEQRRGSIAAAGAGSQQWCSAAAAAGAG
jgi:hypothetical protein